MVVSWFHKKDRIMKYLLISRVIVSFLLPKQVTGQTKVKGWRNRLILSQVRYLDKETYRYDVSLISKI